MSDQDGKRIIGLRGAIQIGVGAIVGGGILALGGVAFSVTGPSAILAFALNGIIAILTALSFAEMSAAFPQSGGLYNFAKRVLSVRAAFGAGWVLWLAYMVAAVLYALGFSAYAMGALDGLLETLGLSDPDWLHSYTVSVILAIGAIGYYTYSLVRKETGGGAFAVWGKVVLFAVLILAGLFALFGSPSGTTRNGMTPFFGGGGLGLLQAMGYTFIALQGFDLIAAVAGEVKSPAKVIPKAMLLSLAIGLIVYLPFLFVVATVGVEEGQGIMELSAASPETIMANAVETYLGRFGFWLVMIAAILAMLSALQANIMAASRVALRMAQDRTLPGRLSRMHPEFRTPSAAIYASTIGLLAILLMIPDLATAGAAASLIFLISFALAHGTSYLARIRSSKQPEFIAPYFPAVPIVGGLACAGLAVFQAIAAPAGGGIVLLWLGMGLLLYLFLFSSRAERADAFAEAMDPSLIELRGRNPLVLVPVANPETAPTLIQIAAAMAPPRIGRVLLLTINRPASDRQSLEDGLSRSFDVLRKALVKTARLEHEPEALMTTSADPWHEIERIAEEHQCESLLMGLSRFEDLDGNSRLEGLVNRLNRDIILVRSHLRWSGQTCKRILVPIGGRSRHDGLRARMLGSLSRETRRKVIYLRIMPPDASEADAKAAHRQLRRFARDETAGEPDIRIIRSAHVVQAVTHLAGETDMVLMGLQRAGRRKLIGRIALGIAKANPGMTVLISHRN